MFEKLFARRQPKEKREKDAIERIQKIIDEGIKNTRFPFDAGISFHNNAESRRELPIIFAGTGSQ